MVFGFGDGAFYFVTIPDWVTSLQIPLQDNLFFKKNVREPMF